jgi:glycosyltransferase involved in cell wall biosynthesis
MSLETPGGGNSVARAVRVGYVVKRYPRYSETFIVTEILAHEAAGLDLEIFSLSPPNDTHFQDVISRVRAPVTYLTCDGLKAVDFWNALQKLGASSRECWSMLESARGYEAKEVHQAIQLALLVRARGITHLHAHFATSATSVARLAARFAGVGFTFTAHAKDIFHESVVEEDLRCKLADADATITVSDYNARFLRGKFGADAAQVKRVYNGLDLANLRFESPRERPPLILAAGRLVEKKGFVDLIDACAVLAAQGRSFQCKIIGGGELEAALRAQIVNHNLGRHVELLGPRPQRDVFELIRSAAVFAAPCVVGEDANRDGLPTVILEAMALGTPCVSTNVTGIPEVLRDGASGLMVPQRDPHALAAACATLLDDAALRARLAAAARELVEAEFDIHRNAARMREIFAQVHRSRAGAAGAAGAARADEFESTQAVEVA